MVSSAVPYAYLINAVPSAPPYAMPSVCLLYTSLGNIGHKPEYIPNIGGSTFITVKVQDQWPLKWHESLLLDN